MGKMKQIFIDENYPELDNQEYLRERQMVLDREWEQYEEWKEEQTILSQSKIEVGNAKSNHQTRVTVGKGVEETEAGFQSSISTGVLSGSEERPTE